LGPTAPNLARLGNTSRRVIHARVRVRADKVQPAKNGLCALAYCIANRNKLRRGSPLATAAPEKMQYRRGSPLATATPDRKGLFASDLRSTVHLLWPITADHTYREKTLTIETIFWASCRHKSSNDVFGGGNQNRAVAVLSRS